MPASALRPRLTIETNRTRLWLDDDRSIIMCGDAAVWLQRKCRDGFHEPKLSRMILDLAATREGAFFDIGALYGYFALLVGAGSDHVREIHAFEMNDVSARAARRMITLNEHETGQYTNTQIRNIALSARDEQRQATVNGFTIALADGDADARSVRFWSIDRYCQRNHVLPAFIKIDIEGWEGLVLNGMMRTLRLAHPVLAMELHGKPMVGPTGLSRTSIAQMLLAVGYRLYMVAGYRSDGPIEMTEVTDPGYTDDTRRFENLSANLVIACVNRIEDTFPGINFTVKTA